MSGVAAGVSAVAPGAALALPAGFRLVALDSVGSTMEEARALAQGGAPDGTVVWAREQTAGRGRQGRGWTSPRGNLFLTLLLRPRGNALAAAQLGFAAGLALAEAVAPLLRPGQVALKWPNDLLVDGAKAAGMLLESRATAVDGGGVEWLLLGLGVNLAAAPAPGETPYRATSLAAACGRAVRPEEVIPPLLARFARWRQRLDAEGFAPLRGAWITLAAGIGGPMTARLSRSSLTGLFRDLDEDGALILEAPDGQRQRVTAADVFFGQG
jgi:BirA family biotin operon repressor/biotin-[acetyl-CoA-carboxylase] ligase